MATVLIVDDDPVSRVLLKSILDNLGYTTFEAEDGRSATHLYRQHLHDVVLLDMIMPDKDGFETLFDLRNSNRDAKIVMMTGGGMFTVNLYEQFAQSLHIPHLLIKPFVPENVARAVAETLNNAERDQILQGQSGFRV
jgi:CheY-like chemotaxis protein